MRAYLFVYGTLRRSSPPRPHALMDGCEWIGRGVTRGTLFDLGPYPAMISTDHDAFVVGDVYEMPSAEDVLKRLDAYEGSAYERVMGPVRLDDGQTRDAWMYVFKAPPDSGTIVPSGDYLKR